MVGLVRIKLRASALYRRQTMLVELTSKGTNQLNIRENCQLTKPSTVTNQTMKLLLLDWISTETHLHQRYHPSHPSLWPPNNTNQQKISTRARCSCFSTWEGWLGHPGFTAEPLFIRVGSTKGLATLGRGAMGVVSGFGVRWVQVWFKLRGWLTRGC